MSEFWIQSWFNLFYIFYIIFRLAKLKTNSRIEENTKRIWNLRKENEKLIKENEYIRNLITYIQNEK